MTNKETSKRERERDDNSLGEKSGAYLHIQGILALIKRGMSLKEALDYAKNEQGALTDPHQTPLIEKAYKFLKRKGYK